MEDVVELIGLLILTAAAAARRLVSFSPYQFRPCVRSVNNSNLGKYVRHLNQQRRHGSRTGKVLLMQSIHIYI